MNKLLKKSFARQKVTVATLCMVCALFFTASGCGKLDYFGEDNESTVEKDGVSPIPVEEESESPYFYYYGGEKVFFLLNTKNALLSVKYPELPDDIAQRGIKAEEFLPDNADMREYKGKKGALRYWTALSFEKDLTNEEYLELLSDIKSKNSDVIIGAYFNNQYGKTIGGLDRSFFVKLKAEGDVALLEQMAEQAKCEITSQNTFAPVWFCLTITETSELNAMEICNRWYESGLFAATEPGFSHYGASDLIQ